MNSVSTKLNRFTMLTKKQRGLFLLVFCLGVYMFINTLYLLFASHVFGVGKNPEVLPVFYQAMLVTHLVFGIVLVAIAVVFITLHVIKMHKKRRPRAWMRSSGGSLAFALVMLLVSGFFILTESNSRENYWIFVSHQALAFVCLSAYFAHRMLSRIKPFNINIAVTKRSASIAASVVFLTALTATFLVQNAQADVELAVADQPIVGFERHQNYVFKDKQTIMDDFKFVPAGDADESSPFFPATTTTSTGSWLPSRIITHDDFPDLKAFRQETEEKGFAPSYFLGAQSCSRCHADIVAQWSTSAHRFSSFNNPFYRRSVELTRDKISKKASQFCGGCHDPAVMLAGNMVQEIDPITPESQAGLTCLACHAIDKVHGVVGNGNYNIHDITESPYIFDQAKSGLGLEVHDYVLKAKPTVHKGRNLKPIFQKSEFCLTCHKVNLDVAVNNYRWLRGQNEYDAWHNSGVALNQPQTWYEPPTVRQCQDCHMPLEDAVLGDFAATDGKVRSHRFLGVNTALPAIRNDQDTIDRIETFLRDNKVRLEIFALRRESGERIMDAGRRDITLNPGELIEVDVVVRNLNVGHMFPGGTNDSNEGWIDFKAQLEDETVFHNGYVRDDAHVDPAAHFYKAVLVDRHGQRIAKRNASDIYATVYANVIGPSTSDIARYRFRLPEGAGGRLRISANLMWRKFNREFTEFVYEGQVVPDLPITVIESDALELHVSEKNTVVSSAYSSSDLAKSNDKLWISYNDYGIGSVLDGDTRTALEAFKVVAQLKPDAFDGYLNQARAHLTEGSLEHAEDMLREASARGPNEARLAFWWGVLLEKKGWLNEAAEAYRRTLQTYPKSRDTWTRLGRVYWLSAQYQDSIAAYKEVLSIDPENALAFHQLHLAYQALTKGAQNEEERTQLGALAEEYKKGFEKYKTDENASAVTRQYREDNPYDNLMSQKLIVHEEG